MMKKILIIIICLIGLLTLSGCGPMLYDVTPGYETIYIYDYHYKPTPPHHPHKSVPPPPGRRPHSHRR